jgi:hypothetical protein
MPPTRIPNIAVFRIQPVNGRLRFSTLVNTPTPVDVEFGSIVQLSFPGPRRFEWAKPRRGADPQSTDGLGSTVGVG